MSLRKPESRFFNSGGKYPTREFNKKLKACQLWENIRQRVEDKDFHKKQPTYANVKICEEWLDYQNFAEWFYRQQENGSYVEGWHLDKDILSEGSNKIYSPETCLFLPKDLNNILISNAAKRGDLPRGVNKAEGRSNYTSRVIMKGLPRLSKNFTTKEAAFEYFKVNKEAYVKILLDKYRDQLNPQVVTYFEKYEVKIDD